MLIAVDTEVLKLSFNIQSTHQNKRYCSYSKNRNLQTIQTLLGKNRSVVLDCAAAMASTQVTAVGKENCLPVFVPKPLVPGPVQHVQFRKSSCTAQGTSIKDLMGPYLEALRVHRGQLRDPDFSLL